MIPLYPGGQKVHRNFEINAFCAEIQDGRPKWQENDFWQKLEDDCVQPGGKNFVEIALSCTVSEILKIFHC